MRIVVIFVWAAAFSWVTAHAGERTVYRGRLGTQDVVLELERNGDRFDGRYFYQRIGVNIPLRGTAQALAEALALYDRESQENLSESGPIFENPRTGKPAGVWSGRISGDRYAGTWRDARNNRGITFDLRRVAVYTTETPMEEAWDWLGDAMDEGAITMARVPYNYLRMHEARLTEGGEVAFGAVAYRMVTDPRTRFAYPRLTRHPDAAVLARTNAELEQRHWRMNNDALACSATAYTSTGPEAGTLANLDDENIQVTYLSPTLMSLVQAGSSGCGGAHPNNHFDPLTLDLRRGGEFDFNRILNADEPPDEDGRRALTPPFAAYIAALVQKMETLPGEDGGICPEMLGQYLGLYFDEDGKLAFAVSGVPHVVGVCLGKVASVPLRDLGALLRPTVAEYFPGQRFD